ncbi:DNA (cytosine-5-)-methyltransferase, partial [Yersinia enterocolitica]
RHVLDERNSLYLQYIRILKDKQPKIFVAENVKGILSLGKGEVIKGIVEDFSKAGYRVKYKLLNSADFGVPQTRMRVFIVGIRNDLNVNFEFPEKTHSKNGADGYLPWVTVKEALSHLPDPDGENSNSVP